MENTPYLYDTLLRMLGQHANWLDLRHLKTLAWMMVGTDRKNKAHFSLCLHPGRRQLDTGRTVNHGLVKA